MERQMYIFQDTGGTTTEYSPEYYCKTKGVLFRPLRCNQKYSPVIVEF